MNQLDYIAGLNLSQRASLGLVEPVAAPVAAPLDPRIQSGIPFESKSAATGWQSTVEGIELPEPEPIETRAVSIEECQEGLTQQQMACIRLQVEGVTITHAAERIGVTRRAAFMWQKKPAFLKVLRQYNKEATQASINKMRQATKKVTDELIRLATDKYVEPKDKLRAASILFNAIQEQDAIEDVSDRITELETNKLRPESGLYRIVQANTGNSDE